MAAPDSLGADAKILGKYTLRGTLGRGAMGTVYDGWDPAIDRRVAIKTVKLTDAEDEETAEALARFKREAQAAGRLSHPNIVGVYDYGETHDLAYIVMEFVEGRSLKSLIDQERRLPPPEAGTIMQQVLDGLAYSHARGVVHRDIKPANIMLTSEGQVKIADFGIARIESSSMTSVGTVMGTPAYMPPEQFLGEPVDARSDIYAAGVMLFHLLTGERPYEGSMTTIMQKVLNADAPPLASARAPVPTVFDRVIAGAMAKVPADRYPTAGVFAQALRVALNASAFDPNADETILAPTRAKSSDGTLGGTARRAAPEPARVSAAERYGGDPVEAAAPEKKKSMLPMLLAGGIGIIAVGAGGAWFALRPAPEKPAAAPMTIPAEPAAPPPITTPPPQVAAPPVPVPEAAPKAAPKASPEQVRAHAAAALAGLPCASLSVSTSEDGAALVQGVAGSGDAEAGARSAAEAAASGAPLTWSALGVPALYCDALMALARAAGPAPLAMTIGGSADHVRLVKDAPISPSITVPDFPASLTVDYLSNDGSMLHMLPKGHAALLRPGTVRALLPKAGEAGYVAPPYGRDLVIAIASSQPLFAHARPPKETMAQYLAGLAEAVTEAHAKGISTAAGVVVVDTAER